MKKICALLLTLSLLNSAKAQERNWAVGLKIGEPLGLNIRKYFREETRAFDLNLGTFGFLYGRERSYRKETIYDEFGLMVQALLHHNFIKGKNDNLNLYFGYGAQFNSRNRTPDIGQSDKFRVVSFGPAGNAGVEVFIPENDISVFLDAGFYMEIAPKPFFLAPNINVGLRLNLPKK